MNASARVVRGLAWFHRWTGVALCLLFLVWFVSGLVLVFVPFPNLAEPERLASSARFDARAVTVAPARALAVAGGGDGLRLSASAHGPVYLVKPAKGPFVAVDATTGALPGPIGPDQARGIARAFASRRVASVTGPFAYDQWVVHDRFDRWRPFFRVRLADAAGTDLYVSRRTGEVVQRTRAAERAWNWVGAVSHWLYFTALRRSFVAWDQTVWWVSLLGLATTFVGIYLGGYRSWKRWRGPRPDWSPYRGWLRWHHGVGLGVALFVLTWILSGWLSMDHGRLFSRGAAPAAAQARYQGATLAAALAQTPAEALAPLGSAAQIDFEVVGGRPVASAEGGEVARVRLLDDASVALTQTPRALVTDAVARGWRLTSRTPHAAEAGDALYRLAEGLPARAIGFDVASPKRARLYLDPVSGRVLAQIDASRRAYAWIYFALHTFNFPFLLGHPILRRALEVVPMLFGVGFSLTGVVIAFRRLRIASAGGRTAAAVRA